MRAMDAVAAGFVSILELAMLLVVIAIQINVGHMVLHHHGVLEMNDVLIKNFDIRMMR